MNKELLQEQEQLAIEIQNKGHNVVNCGDCGDVFLHKIEVDELTCPYCEYTSDICDFPDFIYSGMAESLTRVEELVK